MGTLSFVNTMGTTGSSSSSAMAVNSCGGEAGQDPLVPIVLTDDKVPIVPSVINNDMVEVHFNIKKRPSKVSVAQKRGMCPVVVWTNTRKYNTLRQAYSRWMPSCSYIKKNKDGVEEDYRTVE